MPLHMTSEPMLYYPEDEVQRVVAEAIAAEREACAKIIHDMQIAFASDACGWALDAIRARGGK